jgi:hypothetical protein
MLKDATSLTVRQSITSLSCRFGLHAAELSGLFEDEAARLKSADLVENEDMHAQIQQLLRMFNEGTQSPGLLSADLTQGPFGMDLEKQLKEFALVQVRPSNRGS